MKYGYTRVSTDGQSVDASSSRRSTDRLQVEEAGRKEPSCKRPVALLLFARWPQEPPGRRRSRGGLPRANAAASLSRNYHLTSTLHVDGPVDFEVKVYGLPASDAAPPVASSGWPLRSAVKPVTLPSAIVSATFPSVPR